MTPISLGVFILGRRRDRRNPSAPIRIHTSTHSEDINLLAFHPSDPKLLLSGSADGLLSISNALEDDEDEAVAHVGNWGCSVSRAGWGPAGKDIWSHSDMETLATWNNEVRSLCAIVCCQRDS
jgi:WD40 repeat protein